MPLQVAILWHMHQPYYVDPMRGAALMPWCGCTRRRVISTWCGWRSKFPELRCTFNLTPVLLKQIEELAQEQVRDLWHEDAATPAADLTGEQRTRILEHFFKANWDNMVRPFPRYWSLLQKRGRISARSISSTWPSVSPSRTTGTCKSGSTSLGLVTPPKALSGDRRTQTQRPELYRGR